MKMSLELESKELKEIIISYIESKTNKTVNYTNAEFPTIWSNDFFEKYCKQSKVLIFNKEPVIKYTVDKNFDIKYLSIIDLKECINILLRKNGLRIKGDLIFYMKIEDEETIEQIEIQGKFFAGKIIGKLNIGFEVEQSIIIEFI